MTERTSTAIRLLIFEPAARAAGDPGIPVVVSSDAIVDVLDGPEILVHTPEAIDLSRAASGLPIISTHAAGQVNVGVIRDLRIAPGQPNTMRGMALFGSRADAAGFEADVMKGVISSVSVGYRRMHGKVRSDGVLVTDRWMPFHAAMVAEPADTNAGFWREAAKFSPEIEAAGTAAERAQPATQGVAMTDSTTAAAGQSAETQSQQQQSTTQAGSDGAQERLRIKALQALGRNHNVPADMVDDWIDKGATADEAAHKCLEIIAERAKKMVKENSSTVGMTRGDVQRYSITRAIRACVEKSWPKVAPFEAEMSNVIAQRIGKAGSAGEHTFFVPLEVQWAAAMGFRDLQVATASAGGYLVGTNVLSFIELLRNRSVAMRMGATTMPGLVGSVSIPKQLTSATGYWFTDETGTATESNLTFGQLTLTPKTVGGYVELSRQLLLQSTPNAEGIVNADLARVIALAVDSAAIAGPGTGGQPLGVAKTTGVGTANPTAGSAVVYPDMIRFQTTVANSNAMLPGFAYVTTPTVAGILMGKPRFTNSDTPIWGGTILDGMVVGAPAMTSLQVGSGTMIGGDWSQVVIGEWGTLEIEANPYAQFQAGIVGVRALYTVDIGVRYAAAFAVGTGMTG
jgi:HK97 family phage major capsid protein